MGETDAAVEKARVAVDLLDTYSEDGRLLTTLTWGDEVEVRERTRERIELVLTRFVAEPDGSVKPRRSVGLLKKPRPGSGLSLADAVKEPSRVRVLKVDFVDVQQGDGSLIETPAGRVLLIDGGDNQLFARYLATRYPGSSAASPKEIACILVTHGDADHFAGLTEIHGSEQHTDRRKRVFIRPERVFHNGLVKRPGSVPETRALGPTRRVDGKTVVTGLESDLLAVPDTEMNKPFRAWKRALRAFADRGPIEFRRLAKGDDDAFAFLADEDIRVQVLGPVPTQADGVAGLEFLGVPRRPLQIGHASVRPPSEFVGKSASHTINGHSVVFRLEYGNWSFLYAGDLNEQAERALEDAHDRGEVSLRSEVFKVPHHGSADFSPRFFEAVSPVVSVVSSGDESARKEYIHPRATLMSAIGKHARGAEPLTFVTELVAFFQTEGWVNRDDRRRHPFFAFSRSAFGLVRVRTDGERLLVSTNSGQTDLKEAYAYRMEGGEPVADPVSRI
jgi:beta-lactamase superfamily II metal-dependent hydrolase